VVFLEHFIQDLMLEYVATEMWITTANTQSGKDRGEISGCHGGEYDGDDDVDDCFDVCFAD
jgi:hypothetical protein